MTDDLQQARVEAAAKAIADCHNPGMFEKYPENWRVEARAALAAADAHLPSVEQIAEAFAQSEAVGLRWEQIPPMTKQAYMSGALAVRALFGEAR